MQNTSAPAEAVNRLQAVVQSGRTSDDTVSRMLNEFKLKHLEVRKERDTAVTTVDRLERELSAARAEIERLVSANSQLNRDVQMLSAAIETANKEIVESESNLVKMATAISAEFKAPVAKAVPQPAPARPTSPAAAATPPAPQSARPATQTVPQVVIPMTRPVEAPAAATGLDDVPVKPLSKLDETLRDIQDLMNNDRHTA